MPLKEGKLRDTVQVMGVEGRGHRKIQHLAGIGIRERPEQNRIDHGEDGGVGSCSAQGPQQQRWKIRGSAETFEGRALNRL